VTFNFVARSVACLLTPVLVGDHLLPELLDLRAGRHGRGQLARVDVDLVGGNDDVRDLRVIDGLSGRPGGGEAQRECGEDGERFHLQLLGRE
jgi:hypothetical protein